MIDIKAKMFASNFADVRSGFIARARLESGRIADARQWMRDRGFEVIEAQADQIMTADGREILRAHGKSWALQPEIHAARLAEAFEATRRKEPPNRQPPVSDGESIASIPCPQMSGGRPCGGSLNLRPVCPSCVTGKLGYRYRYTCESCGFDIVTKREMSE